MYSGMIQQIYGLRYCRTMVVPQLADSLCMLESLSFLPEVKSLIDLDVAVLYCNGSATC